MYAPGSVYYMVGDDADQKNARNLYEEIAMFKTLLQLAQSNQIKNYEKLRNDLYNQYANDLNFNDVDNAIFIQRSQTLPKPLDPKQLIFDRQSMIQLCQGMIVKTEQLLQAGPQALYDYWHYWD